MSEEVVTRWKPGGIAVHGVVRLSRQSRFCDAVAMRILAAYRGEGLAPMPLITQLLAFLLSEE